MFISAIILAAGSGTRMETEEDKLFLRICGKTPLELCLSAFEGSVDELIVCCNEENYSRCAALQTEKHPALKLTLGGAQRQDSVACGLRMAAEEADVILIHDGARCFITQDIIQRCIQSARETGSGVAAMPVKDTVKQMQDGAVKTLERSSLWAAQTPQAFRAEIIRSAHQRAKEQGYLGTDDASLVERMGETVAFVEGSYENIKLTTVEDLEFGEAIMRRRMAQYGMTDIPTFSRVGSGYDVHRLVEGRKLILGGVEIPHEKGLLGHSDADVLTHAVMDALLGAAGLGDIGQHFPDTNPMYRGIDSLKLLEQVMEKIKQENFRVLNIDACIIAQRPKLMTFLPEMRKNIAAKTGIEEYAVNIKATTTEGLGFAGRQEGIAANAVAYLQSV